MRFKFGDKLWLRRGSMDRQEGMGKARFVIAELLFYRGNRVMCRLLEDDPFAMNVNGKGDEAGAVGWWGKSSIIPLTDQRPVASKENYLPQKWLASRT